MASTPAISRRAFLKGKPAPPPYRAAPPGASAGLEHCTGCAQCVEVCPTSIIKLEDGQPVLDFSKGECLFCAECARVCPEPVFALDPPTRFAHRATISSDCLTEAGITCMACRDACPEEAIRMQPRIGRPFAPLVDLDACTGCGACVSACPSQAIAMHPFTQEPGHG